MADDSAERARSHARLARLSPQLRAQALSRLAAKHNAARAPGITRSRSTSAPMSFGQQRLWFIHELEPDKPTYVAARLYRITGPLNTDALAAGLDEIVRRHEALRTSFQFVDGEAIQRIEPHTRFEVPTISLGHLQPDSRLQELERLRAEQGRTPFDLARGPLLRALIVRLSASDHGLIVARHHIATDRWSLGVLHRELSAVYEALAEGRPSPLPELPIQYADYARWQREQMGGVAIDRHLAYWKQHLAGAPAHLDVPTDRPHPANPTYDGAFETMTLPAELIARLRLVAAQRDATPYMLFLGALQVLLHRHTGQHDIVVGSPIAGRLREETESLIGFFVNTLALRTKLSGDPTFDEVLDRVRRVALEAYEHQALPFERLVEELQPSREVGRNPVIDVVLAYQNVPVVPLRLGAARVEMLETRGDPVTFDLQMTALETPDGCSVSVDYQRELFDAVTIRRLLRQFETLLRGIADASATPISRLPLLTPAERRQILVEWNDTCSEFAADATLHGLFEAHAARTPDAVAVSFAGVALSYRELNERATRLARLLRQSGVERGSLVALCLERSEALIVAILAILKAGAAYVPIDPAWPARRAQFVVDDAGARVVVTVTAFALQFASTRAAAICLDTARLPEHIVPSGVPGAPDDLAYVIYTSGTTGRPKGTPVTHHNVVRLFRATRPSFSFGADHVWTLLHSVAFDFSVWEMWGALLHGARLLVVPAETTRDAGDLRALIARDRVTVLCQTPSELASLIGADAQATHPLPSLRFLVVGGEALPKGLLRPWFARYGDEQPRVINAYGPTETTMFVMCRRVTSADLDGPSLIGRPVADTRAYILDQHREPAPVGVPGEVVHRRAGTRARISQPGRPDSRRLRHRVPGGPAGAAPVPDRRFRALPWRRRDRIPRPPRPAGEDQGLPHRVGRDRSRARQLSRRAQPGGRRAGRSARRHEARGVHRP